jgi:hypothetical protein
MVSPVVAEILVKSFSHIFEKKPIVAECRSFSVSYNSVFCPIAADMLLFSSKKAHAPSGMCLYNSIKVLRPAPSRRSASLPAHR